MTWANVSRRLRAVPGLSAGPRAWRVLVVSRMVVGMAALVGQAATVAEFVRGRLSCDRLVELLDAKGIDRNAYNLAGSTGGEGYVLDHQGQLWSVFYAERGEHTNRRDFDTEQAACEYLLGLLLDDPTTRRPR